MARRSRKAQNQLTKERRLSNVAIQNIVRSEPVIRVFDRRNDYRRRRSAHQLQVSKGFRTLSSITRPLAPRRAARKTARDFLQRSFPQVYSEVHNCKKEWEKTLSWRSSQGAGRKRTQREKANNKRNFYKRDC